MGSFRFILSFAVFVVFGCSQDTEQDVLFIDRADGSGIEFSNDLEYTEDYNPYTYRNFFNGGGVALGDINNDGWVDIYLTGNLVDNKLYINNGDWTFRDVTMQAGVSCPNVWSTGAVMVDIDGDDLLDIYVCKAGKPGGSNRHNELFINQGDLTFKDASTEYGLDVTGLSIQSVFFDYDRDGDLDCYLLNNSLRSVGGFDLNPGLRNIPEGKGNKFFENRNGKFVDVSIDVGIYTSAIGFGLGTVVSDFNYDGWLDLFVANDFFEKDYLYLNDQEGGFQEVGDDWMTSMSMGSMGCDAADINNDGKMDLFVAEMLPATLKRQKTKAVYDSWDKHQTAIKADYGYQYPRNALQVNNGNGFFELSRFANIEATEWSWSSLLCDLNNDGNRDLYVCNGIGKDLLDRDYLAYMANSAIQSKLSRREISMDSLIDIMPSAKAANVVFSNLGDLNYVNVAEEWGLNKPTFSNGGSYADLDNDGDLDLVINNVNDQVGLYENNTDTSVKQSITLQLQSDGLNRRAIGARVELKWKDGSGQVVEQQLTRGFQSSVSDIIHVGLGDYEQVDTITVFWPEGESSQYYNVLSNQRHVLKRKEPLTDNEIYSSPIVKYDHTALPFMHQENNANEFNSERLLTQMNSNEGPAITVADIDGDGIKDVFIGGAKGQESVLLRINSSGDYEEKEGPWKGYQSSEVVEVVFFDSDSDGDQDLYLGHGDRVFSIYSPELHDVLYTNDGQGNFEVAASAFQFERPMSTGAVAIGDYNDDELLDVFVGERYRNDYYGLPGSGFFYTNLGNNHFELDTVISSAVSGLGMITDALWLDTDEDGIQELIICGEWMPITIVRIKNGKASLETVDESIGLWQDMERVDIDGDGDLDIVIGNVGTNAQFDNHMKMYLGDFDQNGSIDPILTRLIDGVDYPIHDMDEMVSQLPYLKRKFLLYSDYAELGIQEIFESEVLNKSQVIELEELRSIIMLNEEGVFRKLPLPKEIQYSSVYAVHTVDCNKDGLIDIVVGGNQYSVKPQYGRQDASAGWLIIGPVLENKKVISLDVNGEIRDFEHIGEQLIIGINNDTIRTLNLNEVR